jgi:hypothetical protein
MPKPQQRVLRHEVFEAERHLSTIEVEHGKNSPEFIQAQRRFVQLWSMLKMTRSQDEFLSEVLTAR